MDGKRRGRLARVILVIAVAVAATVTANVALLGFANKPNDPVGRLSPVTPGASEAPDIAPTRTTTAPTRTAPAKHRTSPRPHTDQAPAAPRPTPQPVAPTRTGGDDHSGGSKGGGGKADD